MEVTILFWEKGGNSILNFNEEIMLKAKKAKSVEDLLQLAEENNFELTEKRAKEYFDKFNQKNRELGDDELKAVAGGKVIDLQEEEFAGACGTPKN